MVAGELKTGLSSHFGAPEDVVAFTSTVNLGSIRGVSLTDLRRDAVMKGCLLHPQVATQQGKKPIQTHQIPLRVRRKCSSYLSSAEPHGSS